jgi:hypothetical protein
VKVYLTGCLGCGWVVGGGGVRRWEGWVRRWGCGLGGGGGVEAPAVSNAKPLPICALHTFGNYSSKGKVEKIPNVVRPPPPSQTLKGQFKEDTSSEC